MFLKVFCMSGGDCDFLVWFLPTVFFVMSVGGYYSCRKDFIEKIKGKSIYHETNNPSGYVMADMIGCIGWGIGATIFTTMGFVSLWLFW